MRQGWLQMQAYLNMTVRERRWKNQKLCYDGWDRSMLKRMHDQLEDFKEPEQRKTIETAAARNKLLVRLLGGHHSNQVVTLKESILDQADFDRRLKFFLHRSKRSQVIQSLGKKKIQSSDINELRKSVNKEEEMDFLQKITRPGWMRCMRPKAQGRPLMYSINKKASRERLKTEPASLHNMKIVELARSRYTRPI